VLRLQQNTWLNGAIIDEFVRLLNVRQRRVEGADASSRQTLFFDTVFSGTLHPPGTDTCILCKPSCWSCRRDVSPQQDNYDDCGVFAVMIGSQLGACADMHLIQAQLAMQFRFYIALCVIKQWLLGVVVAPATAQARAATTAGKSLNSILTVAS